ncbi:response regulator [Polaribacter litorisediminis]|uniref:response regulator n=1 Tax=Polaribacter litorisediminis TaxID=1908341 RepID=UPI001CBC4BC0|nr:response regulator [Polaribacter litorisediminis]UAM98426.1 response regulator [Polaribacter litorisediminis]
MQQKYSICFIDDDGVYKFFMQGVLNKKKLADNVITFADGEEAYEFINKNKEIPENLPDLIFLDINMPIMDGFQFMDEYMNIHKAIKKKITIFMVTSSIDPIDLERSKQYAEISDFITKPMKVSVLEEIINRLRK